MRTSKVTRGIITSSGIHELPDDEKVTFFIERNWDFWIKFNRIFFMIILVSIIVFLIWAFQNPEVVHNWIY
jgi:hypothetical protein